MLKALTRLTQQMKHEVEKRVLETYCVAAQGDLKSAITMLQFSGTTQSTQSMAGAVKDGNLSMFHALGKVLTSKRLDKDFLMTLPPHLASHERKVSAVNVDEVLTTCGTEVERFNVFLQDSYLGHFTNLEETYRAADHLSIGAIFSENSFQVRSNMIQRLLTLAEAREFSPLLLVRSLGLGSHP